MKKYLFFMFGSLIISTIGVAQSVTTTSVPTASQLTKEEKEKLRLKLQEDTVLAYKEAGISEEQVLKIRAVQSDTRSKIKSIDDSTKVKLEIAVGKDLLKKYRELQKKQKDELAKVPVPAIPLTKEEKQALKLKQEEELAANLKSVGFTDAQILETKAIDDTANKQKGEISKQANNQFNEIAGKDNWKKFKDTLLKLKETAVAK